MRWRRVLGWGCGALVLLVLMALAFINLPFGANVATSPFPRSDTAAGDSISSGAAAGTQPPADPTPPAVPPPARGSVAPGRPVLGTAPPPVAYCALLEETAPIAECARLTEVKARLAEGSAAFNAPATMQRGETVRIRLAIDRDSGSTAPPQMVDALPGDTVAFRTKVGRFMRAELSGEGFKIVALTDARQDFYADDRVLWEWDATATRGGERVLTLRTYVETRGPGGEPRPLGGLRVEDRTIRVEVPAGERIADAVDGATAWAGRGTNLLKALAVLVGAAGALWLAIKGFGRKPKA